MSELFGKVYGVDSGLEEVTDAKKYCKNVDNVEIIQKDIYTAEWDFPKDVGVVWLDAGHEYEALSYDIKRAIDYFDNPIIILDDYGHPTLTVRKAIDDCVSNGLLKIHKFIGEDSGFKTSTGVEFCDREGIICNVS